MKRSVVISRFRVPRWRPDLSAAAMITTATMAAEEEDEIKKVKKGERNQSRKKIYMYIFEKV